MITVKFFASIRESIGHGQELLSSSAPTLGALRDELITRGGAYADSLARGKAVRRRPFSTASMNSVTCSCERS